MHCTPRSNSQSRCSSNAKTRLASSGHIHPLLNSRHAGSSKVPWRPSGMGVPVERPHWMAAGPVPAPGSGLLSPRQCWACQKQVGRTGWEMLAHLHKHPQTCPVLLLPGLHFCLLHPHMAVKSQKQCPHPFGTLPNFSLINAPLLSERGYLRCSSPCKEEGAVPLQWSSWRMTPEVPQGNVLGGCHKFSFKSSWNFLLGSVTQGIGYHLLNY